MFVTAVMRCFRHKHAWPVTEELLTIMQDQLLERDLPLPKKQKTDGVALACQVCACQVDCLFLRTEID